MEWAQAQTSDPLGIRSWMMGGIQITIEQPVIGVIVITTVLLVIEV